MARMTLEALLSLAVVQYELRDMAVELRDVERPAIGERDVLLRVGAVGVCGSDVHQAHNTHTWPVNLPVVLGHEFSGTIIEVGERVERFSPGDRVVSETAAEICGRCLMCRQGQYNLCPTRKGFGYGTHGAMTSFVRAPERCLHNIPETLPLHHAALTEPCCVAYQAVCVNSSVTPGDLVVVLGAGPIGLLCARMAVLSGAGSCVVTGLTRDLERFKVAEALGATHTVDVEKEDLGEAVRALGDGLGADLVVDAAGSSRTVASSMEVVRPGGQITKVGWGPEPLECTLDPLVQKNVTLQGSFSHTYAVWERVIQLLDAGRIPVKLVIGCRLPLREWRQAFDSMHEGEVIKSVLTPED